jgi:hypothetical protein
MNKVLVLLMLAVVLAIVKAVLIPLAITLLLVLVYAFVTRPRHTLVFLAALTLIGLASARPTAFIIALGVLGVVVVVVVARRKTRSQLLLTDGREDH